MLAFVTVIGCLLCGREVDSKAELARRLGKSLQGLYSLELAANRISLKDLVALRHLPGMTDKRLLDLLEAESKIERPPGRAARIGNPVGRPKKNTDPKTFGS
jgi:hypothetical protein